MVNVIALQHGGGAEFLVRELHKIFLSQNINVHAIYFAGSSEGLGKNEFVLGRALRSPLNIFRIRKILKRISMNSSGDLIVHVHLTWPFLYTALAVLGISKVKLIYTEHNTTNKRRKIPFLWVFERLVYGRFSRIICISHGVEKALASWVGPKISQRLVTIPNGSRIYSLCERSQLEGRLPGLVSIGSLSSKKNFATAISAIAQLKSEVDSYTIVGEGPERARLEKIIQVAKLEEKVQLVGWSDAIEVYLHDADVQLIPSLWEGFGLVAVEGMSTGLPVVASNVDGLREVIDETNLSVTLVNRTESVDDWVASIRKALADLRSQGALKLANSSRQQAEKFTLERMAEQYLEVYRQI